jgi:two-component system sensor histidine kinase AlgZ
MTKPRDPPFDPLDPDFTPESRAASLWPESAQQLGPASTQFALSHFDPLADERQRPAATDLCHPALALRLVLGVQVLGAIGALVAADTGQWMRLAAATAFAALAATLLWLVTVCLLQRQARRGGPGTLQPSPLRRRGMPAATTVATASPGATGLRPAVPIALGGVYAWAGAAPLWWAAVLEPPAPARLLGVALAGAAGAALVWLWLDLRARLWRPAEASARLAELQSRIRPHFLFNALNTALALVRVDPDRAERVLEDLSALFREALADSGASVSLAEEIDLAQRYLAIEQVRYGSRLRVEWDVDPAAGAARVPPLVLQPLVENAVRHGVEPSRDGGSVWIRAAARRGHAIVLIRNTVPDEPSRPGAGMALANVRERLRLLHDVGAQCDVWREAADDGEQFHARIVVPL